MNHPTHDIDEKRFASSILITVTSPDRHPPKQFVYDANNDSPSDPPLGRGDVLPSGHSRKIDLVHLITAHGEYVVL